MIKTDDQTKLLLRRDDMVTMRDNTGRTLVHVAAQHNKLGMMRQLLENGCGIDDITDDGTTVLQMASCNGSEDCVRWLCDTYPHLVDIERKGYTALHDALYCNRLNCLKVLCKYADINIILGNEGTALHIASRQGAEECSRWLCETCPHLLNVRNSNGYSALDLAVYYDKLSCLRILSKYVDVDIRDNDGDTALHMASMQGSEQCLKWLCKTYPDLVNVQNNKGETPLYIAACFSKVNCVKLLFGYANENIICSEGTPFHIASRQGAEECLALLAEKYLHMVEVRNDNGYSALDLAAYYDKLKCLKVLSKYIDINIKDQDGETVVHTASRQGSAKCLIWICETHPHLINLKNNKEETALYLAACFNRLPCVQVLCKYADANIKNVEGTALHIASRQDAHKSLDLLCARYQKLLNKRNGNNYTATDIAAYYDNINCLKVLSKYVKMNIKDNDGDTPLHTASRRGAIKCLTWLCETYPQIVNITNKKGESALHLAAYFNNLACVKVLCMTSDMKIKDNYNRTALDFAKEYKNMDCVQEISKW